MEQGVRPAPAGHRRLWFIFGATLFVAFFILGFFGREVYRQAPPIPSVVRTDAGTVLFTDDDILTGQQVWQTTGGQQLGSIWGHGAYQAPDWTADWLHRESVALLDLWSTREHGVAYAALDPDIAGDAPRPAEGGAAHEHVRPRRRGRSRSRAIAPRPIALVAAHYDGLFGGAPELHALARGLRDAGRRGARRGAPAGAHRLLLLDQLGGVHQPAGHARDLHEQLAARAAHRQRADERQRALVDREHRAAARRHRRLRLVDGVPRRPRADGRGARDRPVPRRGAHAVDARRRQVRRRRRRAVRGAGAARRADGPLHRRGPGVLRHPDRPTYLPYALTRTWHLQTAMFWIATAFLAAGLFLAPVVGGREPRFQRLGVNVLFGALLVVVAGSLAGEALAIHQKLGLGASLLVRHAGLRVRGPRPRLADRALRRPRDCWLGRCMLRGARGPAPAAAARRARARSSGCSPSRARRSA